MSTAIEARQARPLNFSSFAHITSVPLVEFDSDGLLFDGVLTDTEIGDCWWYATSRDAADMTRRQSLAAMRDTNDPGLCAALVAYVLGEAL